MIEETNTSGTMTRDYIFGVYPEQGRRAGRRIAWRDSSGNVYYYFADAIGSTRAVTNATGTVCFSADYYPYGQENAWCASRMVLRDDYDTSCLPTYRFTGYEYDSETGNAFFASRTDLRDYYAYARYYSPRLGRFMSPDPLGGNIQNPQSLNRYAYVLNNPETFIDPSGLCPQGQVEVNHSCVTPNSSVTVTAQPVCYGPPQIGDPFAGFWGYVPYYNESSCLLTQDQMGAGGAALFDTPTSNPGLPAIAYMYGGRQHPNRPQTPSWWGTFAKNFFGNFVSLDFYKSEFSSNGCLSEFASASLDALNPASPGLASAGGGGTMAVSAAMRYNAAQAYAASRTNVLGGQGLIFPQKSIPYNNILEGSTVTNLAEGGLGYVDGALFQGVVTEAQAAFNGTCH